MLPFLPPFYAYQFHPDRWLQLFLLDLALSTVSPVSVILRCLRHPLQKCWSFKTLGNCNLWEMQLFIRGNILYRQMWSRNCGRLELKLKSLALTWDLIHREISSLGHAAAAVILKLELSQYERGEQLWLWANWNYCLSWCQKLPFCGDYPGYCKSQLLWEHLEKAEIQLLITVIRKEVTSVHCCIPT